MSVQQKEGRFEKGRWIPAPPPPPPPKVPSPQELDLRIKKLEAVIKGNFTYHVNFGFKETTTVIVSGTLDGKTYVSEFVLSKGMIKEVIHFLAELQQIVPRGRIDGPLELKRMLW